MIASPVVIGVLLALAVAGAKPEYRFVREDIRISLKDGFATIEGNYFMSAPGPTPFGIYYPFPDDVIPEDITVQEVAVSSGTQIVPHQTLREEHGLRIALPPRPQDHLLLEVTYRQRLRENSLRYVLRTTRSWERPLEDASFILRWPDSLGAPRSTLPFKILRRAERWALMRFEAKQFLPDTDLVVTWNRR